MEFSEEQRMLCLALLAYRGYQDVCPPPIHAQRLCSAVQRGLAELEPLRGQWELLWGPATYRPLFAVFDSSAMYVVRSVPHPHRYVIAIRGTNPVALLDWLLGDFMVGAQVPWPCGSGAMPSPASISASISMGLSILQNMRSAVLPPADGWWPSSSLQEMAAGSQASGGGTVAERLRELQRDFQGTLDAAARRQQARTKLGFQAQVAGMVEDWVSGGQQEILRLVERVARVWGGERPVDPLQPLLEPGRLDAGVDLRTFLKAAVAQAEGEVEIIVTGHSKGGALCSTLALWLADMREEWDAARKARVRSFSFAGPTAGNEAFARYSDSVLGHECHRVVNTLDVVPLAWEAETLPEIPRLYEPEVKRLPPIEALAGQVSTRVGPLGYRHVGLNVSRLTGALAPKKGFAEQMMYQHLEGYLELMGLSGLMNLETFLGWRP